jgi:hypothetical protein
MVSNAALPSIHFAPNGQIISFAAHVGDLKQVARSDVGTRRMAAEETTSFLSFCGGKS